MDGDLLLLGRRHADHRGLGDKEHEDHEGHEAHQQPGQGEALAPVGVDEVTGQEGAEDVAEAGVRVPDAHDEASLALPEPVCHDGDHAGPARGLEHAGEDLDQHQVPDAVQAEVVRRPEHHGQNARAQHPKREEISQVNSLRYNATKIQDSRFTSLNPLIHNFKSNSYNSSLQLHT